MNDTDLDAIKSLLGAIVGIHSDQSVFMCHEGAPVAKSRARWSRKSGRFYTPSATSGEQDAIAFELKRELDGKTFVGPVAIVAIFYRPNFQRIDADNLMKLIMDAATQAGAWKDDCYVTAQASMMEFDPIFPRTLIALCPAQSTLDRARRFTCAVCGNKFNRSGKAALKKPPKTCSRECRGVLYERDRVGARCSRCGLGFVRNSSRQRYCSPECRTAAINDPLRRQKRAEQRPWPKCEKCGGRVSRREYLQCSRCRPKGRKRGSKNKKYSDHDHTFVHVTLLEDERP